MEIASRKRENMMLLMWPDARHHRWHLSALTVVTEGKRRSTAPGFHTEEETRQKWTQPATDWKNPPPAELGARHEWWLTESEVRCISDCVSESTARKAEQRRATMNVAAPSYELGPQTEIKKGKEKAPGYWHSPFSVSWSTKMWTSSLTLLQPCLLFRLTSNHVLKATLP